MRPVNETIRSDIAKWKTKKKKKFLWLDFKHKYAKIENKPPAKDKIEQ